MKYTAFIAPVDDFHGTAEGLVEAWQNEHPAVYHHDFEVPDGTSDRIVTLIARGLFWEDQWTMDDTVYTVINDLTPEDTRPLIHNPAESEETNPTCGIRSQYAGAGGVKEVDVWTDGRTEPETKDVLWDDKVNW